MSDIGLRLFQQLKSIDPNANKDDYFDEESRGWDHEALEEDLKIEQDRLRQQRPHTMNMNNSSLQSQQVHHPQIENSAIPMDIDNINNNNLNTNNQSIHHQLPVIEQIESQEDEDIDLQHNRSNLQNNHHLQNQQHQHQNQHHLNVNNNSESMNNGNPTQMPSPNASPSIDAEYQNDDNEYQAPSNNALITNNNHNNIHLNDSHQHENNNNNNNNSNISTNPISNNMIVAQQPKRAKSKSPSKTPSRKIRGSSKSKSPSKSPSTKKSKGGRKRKSGSSEYDHISSSTIPPSKKQKKSGLGYIKIKKNKWNDAALKKLHSLKRQVRNSGWFWEPVDEIRHSAINYYLVCQLPSDYGTICSRLEKHEYDDLDVFLRDCELVFINARMYNVPVHPVHKASMDLEKKFKELMNTFVEQHCDKYGSEQTLPCWQKARRDFKPFAVPVDD